MEEMEGMEGALLIQNKRRHDYMPAYYEHMREDAVFLMLLNVLSYGLQRSTKLITFQEDSRFVI